RLHGRGRPSGVRQAPAPRPDGDLFGLIDPHGGRLPDRPAHPVDPDRTGLQQKRHRGHEREGRGDLAGVRSTGSAGLRAGRGGVASTPPAASQPAAPAAPAAAVPTSAPAAAAPAATAAPQPKRGGTFRVATTSGPPHLDPHITASPIVAGYGTGLWFSRVLKF